jgi:hypothetical protein
MNQAFVAAQTLAAPEITAPGTFDAKDYVRLALEALRNQTPATESSITEQDIAGPQMIPQGMQQTQFVG